MARPSTLTCVLCALAIAAVLGPGVDSARAGTSTTVGLLGCAFGDGLVTVPAGDVDVHLGGYAQGTYGLIEDFLLAQTTTLQVGGARFNLSRQWSAPVFSNGSWAVYQPDRDIGLLEAGDSVTLTYKIEFGRPLSVLFPPVGSSGGNGPYIVTGEGPFTCTVTAR